MGEEQRAAQRIDLPEPVPAKIGDADARIVDVSLIGCRIEHAERLAMGAAMPIRFTWRGENIALNAKVARTEMRSIGGRMMYSTGLQFAASVDESPEAVRRIMASLVKTSVADKPAAEVPIFFERAPFFRHDEEEEAPKAPPPPPVQPPKPQPAPKPQVAAPKPAAPKPQAPPPAPPPIQAPIPAPAPVTAAAIALGEEMPEISGPDFELDLNPTATPTHYDFDAAPAVASQSFELEGEDIGLSFEHEVHEMPSSPSFELEVEEAPRYVRCSFENGAWSVEQTSEPKQPREGFTIADPGDQREIDQFCKTYEYADPETRRMIRVSCELMIAQQRM